MTWHFEAATSPKKADQIAVRISASEQSHSGVSARGQVFVQKGPCMSGRKIIDLAQSQKTASLIAYRNVPPWIECIEVEADALPRAGFHLGMCQQPASDTLV